MARILIAAEGRTVFAEDKTPWPAEGLPDPGTLFTRRRLADGDLVELPHAAEPAAPADEGEMVKPTKKPEKPEGATK
mgnify:CR=1 FL=1